MRRRDFLRVTAAGSVLLGAPSLLAGCRDRFGLRSGDPLQVAEAAGAWIRANGREVRGGTTWPMVPGEGDGAALNLYSGIPGIILFLLELYHATGDPVYLRDAQDGAFLLQGAFLEFGTDPDRSGPLYGPCGCRLYAGRGIPRRRRRDNSYGGLDALRRPHGSGSGPRGRNSLA